MLQSTGNIQIGNNFFYFTSKLSVEEKKLSNILSNIFSGYVPEHGKAIVDHGVGYAVGHDAIGHFDHHTGPFGPFGFYANYYHD